ncbi:MAG: hypothetical protein IKX58_01230 [Clostridia bacterium]|nr:hypothetical protein [Clostridia bacterium]
MEDKRMCLLDDNKVCDDCGECDRCDLDPNKLCDNCCKCLALEDDSEFRTVTLDGTVVSDKSFFHKANADGHELRSALDKAAAPKQSKKKSHGGVLPFKEEEPTELTPELVDYWEQKLLEYGEAPADDGFGEIRVSQRVPVSGGVRPRRPHTGHKHDE